MKKLFSISLSVVMLATLVACGSTPASESMAESAAESTATSTAESAAESMASGDASSMQVGILIPGSPTDGGYSQQAAEAGRYLEETYGCSVAVVEAGAADIIKQEGEIMGEDGYDVVFGHGGQTAAPFAEISAEFPDTIFYTVGGDILTENQVPLIMCAEETTYVAGILAAMMTTTNNLGITLAGDFPAFTKTSNGYALGARSVNPDIELQQAVLSSPDANECYETTLNQIQNGADIIFSNTNEGQSGALKAVSESEGVYALGIHGDFTSQAPDQILMNIHADYVPIYEDAFVRAMEDDVPTEIQLYTMESGATSFEWNEAMLDTIPPEAVTAVEEAAAAIIAGEIDVPNEFEQDEALAMLEA